MKTAAYQYGARARFGLEVKSEASGLLLVSFCTASAAILLLVPKDAHANISPSALIWGNAGILLGLGLWQMRLASKQGDNPWTAAFPLTMNYYFVRYGLGA